MCSVVNSFGILCCSSSEPTVMVDYASFFSPSWRETQSVVHCGFWKSFCFAAVELVYTDKKHKTKKNVLVFRYNFVLVWRYNFVLIFRYNFVQNLRYPYMYNFVLILWYLWFHRLKTRWSFYRTVGARFLYWTSSIDWFGKPGQGRSLW